MDMPKSIEDLRLMSREYMKGLHVVDDIQDEQVYLSYIEDHLKAQERCTATGESHNANAALSPIRNLADFYQRRLNKIQGATTEINVPAHSRSP